MTELRVTPKAIRYDVLLTAQTAISHHDPAIQDDSNRQLFNRVGALLADVPDGVFADAELRNRIANAHPIPVMLESLMQQLGFAEFACCALLKLFLDIYNRGEGDGLFSGMERYRFLETRGVQAATMAVSLREWWSRLIGALQLGVQPERHDPALLELLGLPQGTAQHMLALYQRDMLSLLTIARAWHQIMKLESPEYAAAAGREAAIEPKTTMAFPDGGSMPDRSVRKVEIPAISANSLRHVMVREPAMMHLFSRLGLMPDTPGQGPVPEGVEAMFANGGNIMAGAKQPSNTFTPAVQIRQAYPGLDLVGGVTDSFDIGESTLQIAAWLVCRENAAALPEHPALTNRDVSVFDMLDDVTLTRVAKSKALGQMIWGFETLVQGAQIAVRFDLAPYASVLTHGAFQAALRWWEQNDGTIGGQAARGYGRVAMQYLSRPEGVEGALAEYEAYLDVRREELAAWLCDGTLGTGKVMCAQ